MTSEAGPSRLSLCRPLPALENSSVSIEEWLDGVYKSHDLDGAKLPQYQETLSIDPEVSSELSDIEVVTVTASNGDDDPLDWSYLARRHRPQRALVSLPSQPLWLSRRLGIGTKRSLCTVPAASEKLAARGFCRRLMDTLISKISASRAKTTCDDEHKHSCVICQSKISKAEILTPCGHYYDVSCLVGLVEASTRDESLFPPRCCRQHIPETLFKRHMTPDLAALFTEKSAEFGTVRRVYCANPACSRFLGARTSGLGYSIYTCPSPSCALPTCSRCRTAVNSPALHRCKHDSSHKAVLELAQRKGWSRCPACDQMIELQSGCFHMTCVCSMQFCYLCRAPWKTCACARWEEVELRQWNGPPERTAPRIPTDWNDPARFGGTHAVRNTWRRSMQEQFDLSAIPARPVHHLPMPCTGPNSSTPTQIIQKHMFGSSIQRRRRSGIRSKIQVYSDIVATAERTAEVDDRRTIEDKRATEGLEDEQSSSVSSFKRQPWDGGLVDDDILIRGLLAQKRRRYRQVSLSTFAFTLS
ncbi:hypothetical protein AcV5_000367 [Taiwanofungus camphoratus]|nr:hypothetical protein AcV7_003559 [Antrodia cinnamomea]KAI0938758.1 hypothetical protein AcV5_000367 [Antrodia cinnamomea]